MKNLRSQVKNVQEATEISKNRMTPDVVSESPSSLCHCASVHPNLSLLLYASILFAFFTCAFGRRKDT